MSCTVTEGCNNKINLITLLLLMNGLVSGNSDKSSGEPSSERYRIRPLKNHVNTNYKSANYEASKETVINDKTSDAPILLYCFEKTMKLIVKADVYNNGISVSSEELVLGQDPSPESSCRAFPINDAAHIIEASLNECGTLLSVVNDSLVYSNVLTISPKPTHGIIRTSPAAVPVACHYHRKHVVSSDLLKPTWVPFTSTRAALDLLDVSMRLLAADWHTERTSASPYFQGDVLRIEASVGRSGHVPLRLFMDHCIVTLTPDVKSKPSYAFIENHGCLSGSKIEGAHAQFMPRSSSDKLQMQMDAFRFPVEYLEHFIYITCQLRVTAASQNTDTMNKACSYISRRWQSVDGNDQACSCCDSTCQASDSSLSYEKTVKLGPVAVVVNDKD